MFASLLRMCCFLFACVFRGFFFFGGGVLEVRSQSKMNIAVLHHHGTKGHGSVDTDESYPRTDGALKTWWVVDHCPGRKHFHRKYQG